MNKLFAMLSMAGLASVVAVSAQEPAKVPVKAGCCCAAKSDIQVKGDTAVKPDMTFTVEGMTCAGCAATIGLEVSKLDGVEKASADAKTGELTVVAKKDKKPSMRAVWEAVVKAGYKPTKIVTAAGTFKDLPTCKSQGLPIDDYFIIRSIMAPPGLSAGQRAFWVDVFKKVYESDDWKKFMADNELKPDFRSGAEFDKLIADYQKLHEDIAKQFNWIQ